MKELLKHIDELLKHIKNLDDDIDNHMNDDEKKAVEAIKEIGGVQMQVQKLLLQLLELT